MKSGNHAIPSPSTYQCPDRVQVIGANTSLHLDLEVHTYVGSEAWSRLRNLRHVSATLPVRLPARGNHREQRVIGGQCSGLGARLPGLVKPPKQCATIKIQRSAMIDPRITKEDAGQNTEVNQGAAGGGSGQSVAQTLRFWWISVRPVGFGSGQFRASHQKLSSPREQQFVALVCAPSVIMSISPGPYPQPK